ncbi:type II toxin-antitoxin system HipA family toxin [Paenirhodobacter sp.]|uniref:type II toxin-antitoxin system HipA family toxin n=1 Tax=Paenirhodobacter sp. TaxID=1965326 RepID=UPI003B41B543
MTSEPQELFVWIWLPGAKRPVVAGRVVRQGTTIFFNYGRSYLERREAISIFDLDLPLRVGLIEPPAGQDLAPSLRDALPDRWGRRVIVHEILGHRGGDINEDAFGEMTFMLRSGSDRIGALDFQVSAVDYIPRESDQASLEDLMEFADRIEAGEPVPPALDRTILHGSSIGGARPKALITDVAAGRKLIAKFSAANDSFAMVKGEYATMKLAALAGIDVAPVAIERVLDRDVLLVQRFDRFALADGAWGRRAMVSALTWTQEHEMAAHHISYPMLAEIIRKKFDAPKQTLRELFARLSFNILIGNTDDHARNHAAFWDGRVLRLTPAYDIAPQRRGGAQANQALIVAEGDRRSRLEVALHAAPAFQLEETAARDIIDRQADVIRKNWGEVADEARMSNAERRYFEGRQILNPYAFEGYGTHVGVTR